jgi:hypothetical protein
MTESSVVALLHVRLMHACNSGKLLDEQAAYRRAGVVHLR